jgi:hypothetical protein
VHGIEIDGSQLLSRPRALLPNMRGWITSVIASIFVFEFICGLRCQTGDVPGVICNHHGRPPPPPPTDPIRILYGEIDKSTGCQWGRRPRPRLRPHLTASRAPCVSHREVQIGWRAIKTFRTAAVIGWGAISDHLLLADNPVRSRAAENNGWLFPGADGRFTRNNWRPPPWILLQFRAPSHCLQSCGTRRLAATAARRWPLGSRLPIARREKHSQVAGFRCFR